MLVQQRNPNNGTHWFSTEEEGYYGNSKRLIICDPEKGYARALGMFLSQKRELSLQVQVYTDLEGVEEEQADCLIISDQFPEEERKKLTGKTVFLLTGDPGQPPGEGEEILYKYQPGEKILEAVLKAWGEKGSGEDIFRRPSGREPGKLIGVFSPVHRIGKTGYALRLGEELAEDIYAFPSPEALAAQTPESLAFLRAGWRAAYLIDAARAVASGRVSEEALAALPTGEARALLMTIRGVGPKVADCVLLYGLSRWEVMPMDVWMKRAMGRLFPRGAPVCCRRYQGIAQQFIFDYARASLPRGKADKKTAKPRRGD